MTDVYNGSLQLIEPGADLIERSLRWTQPACSVDPIRKRFDAAIEGGDYVEQRMVRCRCSVFELLHEQFDLLDECLEHLARKSAGKQLANFLGLFLETSDRIAVDSAHVQMIELVRELVQIPLDRCEAFGRPHVGKGRTNVMQRLDNLTERLVRTATVGAVKAASDSLHRGFERLKRMARSEVRELARERSHLVAQRFD